MPRVLACDKVSAAGIELLRQAGEVVEAGALAEDELIAALEGIDALMVRSATKVTARVFENAPSLRVVARAGVGVDNIDVDAATRCGVLVVNSPAGNILAAAEHTVALLLSAARHIPQANASMKAGKFDRKSFMGRQVVGKTLGVVGLGKIGTEVARRARALGLELAVYDPYAPAEHIEKLGGRAVSLEEALRTCDFLTVHTPLTDETRGLIGAAELAMLRPHAVIVNCARGGIIDEGALLDALNAEAIAVAALDVFVGEPDPNWDLVKHERVIATPHLGASTSEAQEMVALDAAQQILDVLSGRPPHSPVNVPAVSAELLAEVQPFITLTRHLGRLGRVLTSSAPREIRVTAASSCPPQGLPLLSNCLIAEVLAGKVEELVNEVNAMVVARDRGIKVAQTLTAEDRGYSRFVSVEVRSADGRCTLAGAVLEGTQPRVLSVDGFSVDIVPLGEVLLIWKRDPGVPGFIGALGTLLAQVGVGINSIQAGLEETDGVGLMVARLSSPATAQVREAILSLPDVARLELVGFS
jgi:D-3-phosphoglycerate dehydrogenase / 2-oxoglutarate reductase